MHGAERRSDRMVAEARRRRRRRRNILIADLRRCDDVEENGETEGGHFRPPRPVTRRDHTQLTQRYAALTRTMMKPRCLRLTHRRAPMINPSAALTLRSRYSRGRPQIGTA